MTSGPNDNESDHALVLRAQQGDRLAFNGLVERYQARAYALALRTLGNQDVAADVTQDAFISAFKAISSFRGGAFHTWLFRIVNNACYDYFRSRNRRSAVSLDEALEQEQVTDAGPGRETHLSDELIERFWEPERLVLRGETISLLERLLMRLPADQRIAVILCDIQGMSYEEVAQATSASLGTVKSRISRGRAHLRRLISAETELYERASRPHGESKITGEQSTSE